MDLLNGSQRVLLAVFARTSRAKAAWAACRRRHRHRRIGKGAHPRNYFWCLRARVLTASWGDPSALTPPLLSMLDASIAAAGPVKVAAYVPPTTPFVREGVALIGEQSGQQGSTTTLLLVAGLGANVPKEWHVPPCRPSLVLRLLAQRAARARRTRHWPSACSPPPCLACAACSTRAAVAECRGRQRLAVCRSSSQRTSSLETPQWAIVQRDKAELHSRPSSRPLSDPDLSKQTIPHKVILETASFPTHTIARPGRIRISPPQPPCHFSTPARAKHCARLPRREPLFWFAPLALTPAASYHQDGPFP